MDILTESVSDYEPAKGDYFSSASIPSAKPATSGSLDLDTTRYWPKPGIYWLGPNRWPDDLSKLAQKLGHLSSAAGGKREKRNFQPHVTLYRRCQIAPPAPLQPPSFRMHYDHCTLFESRQGRQGVTYHALEHWPLRPMAGEPQQY